MLVLLAPVAALTVLTAQTQTDPSAASPDIVAAKARAERIIAEGDAKTIFENATTDATPKARHRLSGMVCAFHDEERDRITIYPAQGGLALGEDVGCTTRIGSVDFNTYATRYAERYDAAFVLRDAMAAIRNRWPDARPYEGALVTATANGGPDPVLGAMVVRIDNTPMLTLAMVAHRGEWSFKGRATGPKADETVNLTAAILFASSLPVEP